MAPRKMNPVLYFRVSLVCALVLLSVLVLNAFVAVYVGGQLRVIAQFFPRDLRRFSDLTVLSDFEIGPKDKAKIDEMLARYYVEVRYTQIPDRMEMIYRWGRGGPLYLLSSPALYIASTRDLDRKLEDINRIQTIKITEVKRALKGNQFTITFFLYKHRAQGGPEEVRKKVILTFRYESRRKTKGVVFSNPYGFTVVDFSEE